MVRKLLYPHTPACFGQPFTKLLVHKCIQFFVEYHESDVEDCDDAAVKFRLFTMGGGRGGVLLHANGMYTTWGYSGVTVNNEQKRTVTAEQDDGFIQVHFLVQYACNKNDLNVQWKVRVT